MKAAWTILLAIGCPALGGAMCHAAPSGQAPTKASSPISAKPNADTASEGSQAKPPAGKNGQRERQSSRAPTKNEESMGRQALSRKSGVEAVRPTQHLSVKGRRTMGSSLRPQQLRQLRSARDQKGIPIQISPSVAVPATRSFRAIRSSTQLLGTVPHRGVNPPAISGAATVHHLDNSGINGVQVHRKP